MRELIKLHITATVIGIILDLILGDPPFLPHPVRAMGKLIACLEGKLLGRVSDSTLRDRKRERRRGILLWFVVVFVTATLTGLFFLLPMLTASLISPAFHSLSGGTVTFDHPGILNVTYGAKRLLWIIPEAVIVFYSLASKSLCSESVKVYDRLKVGDIKGARSDLSMIVGRDTKDLDEGEVIKAAVETVAENTSDGVIAPLSYALLLGPVFAMVYKAVNTMDSMIGYKNERYADFGVFAAFMDDLFNFIPSRLSAVFMIGATGLLGLFSKDYDGKEALRIFKRDRKNHLSPNSAQTESVCAGALGLRLGGSHSYGGKTVEKPFIGDERKRPEAEDIIRANRLMFMTEAITATVLILLCLARLL